MTQHGAAVVKKQNIKKILKNVKVNEKVMKAHFFKTIIMVHEMRTMSASSRTASSVVPCASQRLEKEEQSALPFSIPPLGVQKF